MKISERTIKFLGKTLCGDNKLLPYKTGSKLVDFFVYFGANDKYGEGFPSRWFYTEEKVREFNNSSSLKEIIEASVDPRDLFENEVKPEVTINEINKYLVFDGYELKKSGEFYKIHDLKGILIQPNSVMKLNHDFIDEQIKKCNDKISNYDFNGAITNARSLVEAVMIEIIEDHEKVEIKNDGDLDKLYRQVKRILNLTIDSAVLPPTIIQILSGLESISKGLAGLSNNYGDRHANKFNTMKHHAKLAVNTAMTFVDFLLDSKEYQKNKQIEQ